MGFNRGKIKVKAKNISERGESISRRQVMSGAITATVTAHSHLDGRVKATLRDSLHPTTQGTGDHIGRSTGHEKKIEGMYS